MADAAGGSITPFFTIWTEPRATIRRIVDTDPTRNVIALAAIGPAINALAGQWSKAMEQQRQSVGAVAVVGRRNVAFQAVLGVVFLYIGAAVLKWSGGLIGGVASRVEMRAAMAWSQIPGIAAEIVLLIAVLTGVPVPQAMGGASPHHRSRVLQNPDHRSGAGALGRNRRAVLYRRGASILGVAGVLHDADPGAARDGRPRTHLLCSLRDRRASLIDQSTCSRALRREKRRRSS